MLPLNDFTAAAAFLFAFSNNWRLRPDVFSAISLNESAAFFIASVSCANPLVLKLSATSFVDLFKITKAAAPAAAAAPSSGKEARPRPFSPAKACAPPLKEPAPRLGPPLLTRA